MTARPAKPAASKPMRAAAPSDDSPLCALPAASLVLVGPVPALPALVGPAVPAVETTVPLLESEPMTPVPEAEGAPETPVANVEEPVTMGESESELVELWEEEVERLPVAEAVLEPEWEAAEEEEEVELEPPAEKGGLVFCMSCKQLVGQNILYSSPLSSQTSLKYLVAASSCSPQFLER